jgi:hypothetical protein
MAEQESLDFIEANDDSLDDEVCDQLPAYRYLLTVLGTWYRGCPELAHVAGLERRERGH